MNKIQREAVEKVRARYQRMTGCTRDQAVARVEKILRENDNRNNK